MHNDTRQQIDLCMSAVALANAVSVAGASAPAIGGAHELTKSESR